MTLTHFRGFLPLLYCGSSVSVSQKLALIIKGTLWSKTLLTKMSEMFQYFALKQIIWLASLKLRAKTMCLKKQQQLIVAAPQKHHRCYYGV